MLRLVTQTQKIDRKKRHGIVLILTLFVLVVLSVVGYTLTAKVSSYRHRCQYLIDYQSARYACDAGTKYALINLSGINAKPIERSDVPDFSDLFGLTDEEYQQILDEYVEQKMLSEIQKSYDLTDTSALTSRITDPCYGDVFGIADNNLMNNLFGAAGPNAAEFNRTIQKSKPQEPFIPGPYGPEWPLVSKPMNFQIGSSRVTIKIEDENAKYPLGWALLADKNIQLESQVSFQTFCEWMNIYGQDFSTLQEDLGQIAQIKTFQLEFKDITKTKKVTTLKKIKRGNRTINVPKTTTKKTIYKDRFMSYSLLLAFCHPPLPILCRNFRSSTFSPSRYW